MCIETAFYCHTIGVVACFSFLTFLIVYTKKNALQSIKENVV